MINVSALDTAGSGISSTPYTPYTPGTYGNGNPTTGGNIPIPQGGAIDSRPSIPTDSDVKGSSGFSATGPQGGGFKIFDGFSDFLNATEDNGYDGESGGIVLPPYMGGGYTGGGSDSGSVSSAVSAGASNLSSIIGALTGLLGGDAKTSTASGVVATQVPVATNPTSTGGSGMSGKLIVVLALIGLGYFGYKKGWFSRGAA